MSFTGTHWLWVGNLDPQNVQVLILVYRATGDARDPLELLVWGQAYIQGDLEVYLKVGQIYYVKVVNLTQGQVGCYDLILDP